MTRQELFDALVVHLLRQGERSYEEGKGCRYRGPNGLKCPVGAALSDLEYKPEMEGKSLLGMAQDGMLPPRLIEHMQLLGVMQYVHDVFAVEKWRSAIQEAAMKLGLELNIPEELK